MKKTNFNMYLLFTNCKIFENMIYKKKGEKFHVMMTPERCLLATAGKYSDDDDDQISCCRGGRC